MVFKAKPVKEDKKADSQNLAMTFISKGSEVKGDVHVSGNLRVDGVIQMDQSRAKSLQDNVNNYRLGSYVLYGIGGAAVIGGVTWLLLDQKDEPAGEGTVTPVSAAPIPGGGIVTFGGSF